MESTDLELIDALREKDPQLATLWDEHRHLERRLEKLEHKPFLSPEEQKERNHLKKMKLAGRDQIENILAPHRAKVRSGCSCC